MSTPARRLAHRVLLDIEAGARVAPALDRALRSARLDDRDRRAATDLVYGVTRGRRFLDAVAEPHLRRSLDPEVRAALRLGTFELLERDVPAHAAVSEAAGLTGPRARGLVNAVLRRISESGAPGGLASAVRLSYPDWIVETLSDCWGRNEALAALEAMNEPSPTARRADGSLQDASSQAVVELVGAGADHSVLDVCAAPGGKATGMAAGGAAVVGLDRDRRRLAGVRRSPAGRELALVVGDGRRPPFRGRFDRVLVDAPCSGLGALRRRADARWRIDAGAVDRLAGVQRELAVAAADLVAPGGRLFYSVCTLTEREAVGVADELAASCPQLEPVELDPGTFWRRWGSGLVVLPQDHGSDGMAVFAFERR